MKRLDELNCPFCRRVVSGPLRVTGCVVSDRESPADPGARNLLVNLAQSERVGSLQMEKQ